MYDVAIIGGGPAGATAAQTLAQRGISVLLLDREGRIKPCGGAVPPQLLREFSVPDALLEARITSARMVAPSSAAVDMEIGGFVGMVDREHFDAFLRRRAKDAGAHRYSGTFTKIARDSDGSRIEISSAMIATTTSNSISVKPRAGAREREAHAHRSRCIPAGLRTRSARPRGQLGRPGSSPDDPASKRLRS